jgi:hypothetical protein
VAAAPSVLLAPKSRLAYPSDADLWVDAQGAPSVVVPGVPVDAIKKLRVVVFRPKGDTLPFDPLKALYVSQGLLPAGAKEALSISQTENTAPGLGVNQYETHVFETGAADENLVLGLVRNLGTQHQLAFAALLTGALDHAQAYLAGKTIAAELAEAVRLARLAPAPPAVLVPPPGSVFAAPTNTLSGPLLPEVLKSIEQGNLVSPRVKAMARVVIPQATSITLKVWRTSAPLADEAFLAFYIQQAARLGWGPPISQDQTQAGRPTLLFQRPNNDGVVMVRANPAPLNPSIRPATIIKVLEMEGKIDAASLRSR